MNTPPRKRRNHPLAILVVALACGLLAMLMALVLTANFAALADAQLDSAYAQGMTQGYQLCNNDHSDRGAAQ